MPIEFEQYGARPLDDENFEYRFSEANINMLHTGKERTIDFAVETQLKRLGEGWEFDHIITGSPFLRPEEQASLARLVFRKMK